MDCMVLFGRVLAGSDYLSKWTTQAAPGLNPQLQDCNWGFFTLCLL